MCVGVPPKKCTSPQDWRSVYAGIGGKPSACTDNFRAAHIKADGKEWDSCSQVSLAAATPVCGRKHPRIAGL
jgi:hypothetical protein